MLYLYLIRHAQAEEKSLLSSDFDRKLTEKGEKQSKHAGKLLAYLDIKPDQIISSPAARTLETAQIVAKQVNYKTKEIILEPSIYDNRDAQNTDISLETLYQCGEQEVVFRVGHSPGLDHFQQYLTGKHLTVLDLRVPKACIIGISFEANNRIEAHKGSGTLVFYHAL